MRELNSAREKASLRGRCLLIAALMVCVVCGLSRASGPETAGEAS